ncbi:MAG: ABC transporter ATP-binding protein [Clostridia bacterium]|nr:ABC transporter ATP-binding protein [Clostridia bacterium]
MTEESKTSPKIRFFGIGKILPFVAVHKKLYLTIILSVLPVMAINTVLPLFQKYAIDNFIANRTLDGFAVFITLYASLIVLSCAVDFVSSYSCSKLEMYLLRDMRRSAFNHLQTLSVSYYNVTGVGKIHARVMSDTGSIGSVIAWDSYGAASNLLYVVMSLAIMFSLDALLTLCVLALVPVIVPVMIYFHKIQTKYNRKVRETNSLITGGFNEGITGVETTKTLVVEDKLDESFFKNTKEMKRQSVKLGHHRSTFMAITSFVVSSAVAIVLWYGGIITVKGVMIIGTLSVFMTYAQGIVESVQFVAEAMSDLVTIKVNIERYSALMETQTDVRDAPEVIEKYGDSFNEKRENWEPLSGEVEFKDVTFRYPDGDENVLEHFNLKVGRGTTVAIVGETGAGKSTLVNLVCRFFDPTEGAVLIDGRDARERSVQWLHSNIGYVLQVPHLFSGTVRENLLYGKPDATQEEMEEAVKSVNAERVIERLGGYDAQIGEGGNTLSTGEKQLLSFARAILADPAIFILDEATSSVDTITENLIQQAIDKLMQGRTNFVIAHRLSTIRNADIILVVHDGKIIERGTHDELIKQRGTYFDLYLKQFREENVRQSVS